MIDPVMIHDAPSLTVLVPSFNQGSTLARCIDSALEQSHRPTEVLVVDGASTDETLDVLHGYDGVDEVRWVSEPDNGVADAVNKGIALASGEVIGIQSSDDYYLPGAFDAALSAFVRHSSVGLVYGDVQTVNRDECVLSIWRRPPHENDLCLAMCIPIPQSSAFFRRDLARGLGGWRTEYHTADWDLWLRMMHRAPAIKVDGVWSSWRVYPGQRSSEREAVFEDFRRMVNDAPEVQSGSWRTRQAGRAAKQLIGVSYARRGPWSKAARLAAATAMYPAIWPHVPGKRGMLPTRAEVARWARGVVGRDHRRTT